jgi:murein DD-endopeptidase MepM/ murein hydrolase activator NlpD
MVHLAIDRPPSSDRGGPSRLVRGVVGALALAVALGAGFWLGRATAPVPPPPVAAAPTPAPAPPPAQSAAPSASAAEGTVGTAPAANAAPAAPAGTTPAAVAVTAAPAAPAFRRAVVALAGPLEQSIAAALAPEDRAHAEELTAVVNRLLVWDLHVARDSRKGDRLEILWNPPQPAAPGVPVAREPTVEAVRYASSKLGAVVAAYRFQPEGARWARHYRADGTEVETRLVDGPIGDYEQVTSLLRDGRRHKGVDFKTPVGSPVLAPFDGVVARRNWNFSGNGNCLDVRDPASGRHAIFLHLDVVPREMGVGRRVKKGQVIAASGNSGRSYAPHLHYQLEDAAGRVLDPYDVHRTERRGLSAASRAAFDAARARLEAALKG